MVRLSTLFCLFVAALSSSCNELIQLLSENEAMDTLKENTVAATEACILSCIEKDWWDLANALASAAMDNNISLSSAVKAKSLEKRAKVDKMIATFDTRTVSTTRAPAFHWAQSASNVFIEVIYAIKIGHPSCNNLHDEKVTFEAKKVKFSGVCHVGNERTTYAHDLVLYDEIDPENSSWSRTGANTTTTITMAKKNAPSSWPRLIKGAKFKNMHIWKEEQEKYSQELRDLNLPNYTDDEEGKEPKTDL